jgi:hypothetical protein
MRVSNERLATLKAMFDYRCQCGVPGKQSERFGLALDLIDARQRIAELEDPDTAYACGEQKIIGLLGAANKRIAEQKKRIAELQADAERLDTVQALGLTLVQFSANHWVYGRCSAKTAREAIDMQRDKAAQRQKVGE